MKKLFDVTNQTAYHIWEASKSDNALNVWYCAEDIASWFEKNGLFTQQDIIDIRDKGSKSYEYTDLIRNIAFRIYIYTCNDNQLDNWFASELLINDEVWINSVTAMARYYLESKASDDFLKNIKSDRVKDYYYPFSQK